MPGNFPNNYSLGHHITNILSNIFIYLCKYGIWHLLILLYTSLLFIKYQFIMEIRYKFNAGTVIKVISLNSSNE